MRPVTAVLPDTEDKSIIETFKNLDLVEEIIIVSRPITSHKTLNTTLEAIKTDYFLLFLSNDKAVIENHGLSKMLEVARSEKAGIVYSDFYKISDGVRSLHPLIDFQLGSVRDDFDFGKIILFSKKAVVNALKKYGAIHKVNQAGLYDLRLKVSIDNPVYHIREPLYEVTEYNIQKDGELFAYVDPKNLSIQKEMEVVFTEYLKKINAYIPQSILRYREQTDRYFPVVASVIIPVKNRVSTIADAVKSALNQKTDFEYNVIVVDNHSEDGTTDLLVEFAKRYSRVIHIIPKRYDLGIGGCWNEAICSFYCGRYAVQLDSDDLYSTPYTLQKIVDMLRENRFAMVIGSYRLVDFDLNEIPPGLIDHRELSEENGHNNALRVNGLGAPRAYDTELVREIGFLNISYGEDYHMALRICGEYKIGRIFECLYLCRRWKDNTDADLTVDKKNANNLLKDRIRTEEILRRQARLRGDKSLSSSR